MCVFEAFRDDLDSDKKIKIKYPKTKKLENLEHKKSRFSDFPRFSDFLQRDPLQKNLENLKISENLKNIEILRHFCYFF